jgi:transketolase
MGKAPVLREGKDVTLAALGIMVAPALEAAANLKKENIECRVMNMSCLQPIDEDNIIKAAKETGAIVTAEEHLEHGGLGSTVAQITGRYYPVPIECVALRNYAQSGKPAELLSKYGLTAQDIEKAAKKAIERKLK